MEIDLELDLKTNQCSRILKSERGFGITEILVALGLMTIVSAGIAYLMSNMQNEQRRMALLQTLASQKIRFENAILNPKSWTNTMNENASMACLSTKVACGTTLVHSGSYDLGYAAAFLRDGTTIDLPDNPGIFYTFAGADGAIQGFTESGMVCNTFTTAAAGNDACPIGYRVSWAPHNITTANPMITVYAKMIYNPSDANPFKAFLNAPPTSTIVNTKYDAIINRAPNKTFRIDTACLPSSTVSCTVANGIGFSTCDVEGEAYGPCEMTSCNSGYYRAGETCLLRVCTPNTMGPCPVINGTGTALCNGNGSSYGSCTVTACNSGAYLVGQTCVLCACTPNTASACPVINGTGAALCDGSCTSYGSCTVTACNTGYALSGGACVQSYVYRWRSYMPDNTPYDVNFQVTTHSPAAKWYLGDEFCHKEVVGEAWNGPGSSNEPDESLCVAGDRPKNPPRCSWYNYDPQYLSSEGCH